MSNALKILMLAAGTVITVLAINLGFYVGREASATTTQAVGKISKMNKEFSESEITMYDGLPVSGSEVINNINKFKADDISIKVTTKKSTVYYIRQLTNSDKELGVASPASVKDTQVITSPYYINQKASFTGEVIRDVNDTPIGISFVQN